MKRSKPKSPIKSLQHQTQTARRATNTCRRREPPEQKRWISKPSGRQNLSLTNSVARWARQCAGSDPAADAAGKYLPPAGLKGASANRMRLPNGLPAQILAVRREPPGGYARQGRAASSASAGRLPVVNQFLTLDEFATCAREQCLQRLQIHVQRNRLNRTVAKAELINVSGGNMQVASRVIHID
ncbi:hypothetical protein FF011L_01000 [Roseimaritima multifibrata]|uniref:Uncharacterized protein n=1 Tax=Roseimaritima multifibrata TaxID=1930274 RepID=A0A517M964_9BACT|nr:hypothetical protein FF011L_01000 [Roseimaritima multifibrata]